MTIGIIGAGHIGSAIARGLARAGIAATISNSRDPKSLAPLAEDLGTTITAGSRRDAAQADIVFLAVPWPQHADALSDLPEWNGRIVVDAMNAILPGMKPADFDGRISSEVVAARAPGARVVKAFNTLPAAILAAGPRQAGGRRVLFLSGDDASAKADLAGLIDRMRFASIDLGALATGGRLQQFPGGSVATLNLLELS